MTNSFPRIDPMHPLNEAARYTNAYAEEHGLEKTVEWLGMGVVGGVAYLAEQRAIRAVAAHEGYNLVPGAPDEARALEAVRTSPLWRDVRMRALLMSCYLDGIAIGWKGRELHEGGRE